MFVASKKRRCLQQCVWNLSWRHNSFICNEKTNSVIATNEAYVSLQIASTYKAVCTHRCCCWRIVYEQSDRNTPLGQRRTRTLSRTLSWPWYTHSLCLRKSALARTNTAANIGSIGWHLSRHKFNCRRWRGKQKARRRLRSFNKLTHSLAHYDVYLLGLSSFAADAAARPWTNKSLIPSHVWGFSSRRPNRFALGQRGTNKSCQSGPISLLAHHSGPCTNYALLESCHVATSAVAPLTISSVWQPSSKLRSKLSWNVFFLLSEQEIFSVKKGFEQTNVMVLNLIADFWNRHEFRVAWDQVVKLCDEKIITTDAHFEQSKFFTIDCFL